MSKFLLEFTSQLENSWYFKIPWVDFDGSCKLLLDWEKMAFLFWHVFYFVIIGIIDFDLLSSVLNWQDNIKH